MHGRRRIRYARAAFLRERQTRPAAIDLGRARPKSTPGKEPESKVAQLSRIRRGGDELLFPF